MVKFVFIYLFAFILDCSWTKGECNSNYINIIFSLLKSYMHTLYARYYAIGSFQLSNILKSILAVQKRQRCCISFSGHIISIIRTFFLMTSNILPDDWTIIDTTFAFIIFYRRLFRIQKDCVYLSFCFDFFLLFVCWCYTQQLLYSVCGARCPSPLVPSGYAIASYLFEFRNSRRLS